MVAPLRVTETLREAQGGKKEDGEGKMRKRRKKGGQDEANAEFVTYHSRGTSGQVTTL